MLTIVPHALLIFGLLIGHLSLSPALAANPGSRAPANAFENSLGMKFVPVPGTSVLFSIWETRVQDYAAFMKATGRQWKPSGEALHPAMDVPWAGAQAFCRWLTEKERKEGKIGRDQTYRLPTDVEWSTAVGLPSESGATPQERDMKIKGIYPWGPGWPPPSGAGNFGRALGVDDFTRTTPVGSFPPNQHGLHDLGGNVWEWVADKWSPDGGPPSEPRHDHDVPDEQWIRSSGGRVLRGGSFYIDNPFVLLSSYRLIGPDLRYTAGFRVVLTAPRTAR